MAADSDQGPDLAGSGHGEQVAALVVATWRTSSRSATQGDCVEIAQTPTVTGIRDSKNPTGGRLILTQPTALLP